MSAEKLVQLAYSNGLLSAKRFEKIMRQLQSASKPVSAEKIASLMVDKKLIANDEAERLLAKLAAEASSKSTPLLKPLDDELEMTADEPAVNVPPVDAPPVPVEAELEVIEDEPVAATPPPPLAELEEVDAIIGGSSVAPPAAGGPGNEIQIKEGQAAETLDHHGLEELDAQVTSGGKIGKKKGLLASLGLRRRARAPRPKGNRWDSPLMLVGGGTLLLMVIGGGALGYFLTRETGEEVFATAEEDYRAQKYTNAISKYERFLERFPSHPKVSIARVRRSMARIRQAVESGSDWERALSTTTRELPLIKSEEAFQTEARPDLSRLLPDIYAGFVDSASKAVDTTQKQSLLDKSTQALQLIDNPEYLPGSLRKTVQLDIERTDEKAALIIRDINREKELNSAIASIQQSTANQDTAQAYATRNDLLSRYPGLATHADLVAVVQEITGAERAKVVVNEQGLSAETTDHPVAIPSRVTLAARQSRQPTGIQDHSIYALARGALYGLNANDGAPLWRRWVGYANPVPPQPISTDLGADALAFDGARQELMRLGAKDGQLVWRLPLGGDIASPVVDDGRIAVALRSGKLTWVDAATGTASPVAELPQQLAVSPGIDPQKGRLYQIGHHSSLYVLSADTLACDEVAYIGHRANSVKVPAISVAGHVFVAENGGEFSWLHVFVGDANGVNLRPAMQKIRLDDEVNVPMQRFGRRLLVVTDRGALHVYNVDPANTAEPVREVAKTLPTNREKGITYPVMASGQIILADNKLARFELQASRGELVRKWADEGDEIYVTSPQIRDNVMFTFRRQPESSATQVTAMRSSAGSNRPGEGELLWTTDLGAAPSMSARYDAKRQAISVVSSEGGIWDIGRRNISAGVQDQLASAAQGKKQPVVAVAVLDDGRTVLAPKDGGRPLILMNPAASQRFQNVAISISPQYALTEPVAFGNQMLVCSSSGAIHALDPSGAETVLPFQPELKAGTKVRWLPPAVVDASQQIFVAANQDGTVYLITPVADPKPHFNAAKTAALKVPLTRRLAVVDNQALVVVRDTHADQLQMLSLPDLSAAANIPIEGRINWGPRSISKKLALIATDANQIIAIGPGGKVIWSSPLRFGPLAGEPLINNRSLLLTSLNGQVWRVSLQTGDILPWSANMTHLDVGEPLGAGAATFANRLLLLGRDSTLFLTDLPQLAATAATLP